MIEHGAIRRCEDLFERSESRSTMLGDVILTDSERATSSLFVCFLSVGTERKNVKRLLSEQIPDQVRDEGIKSAMRSPSPAPPLKGRGETNAASA